MKNEFLGVFYMCSHMENYVVHKLNDTSRLHYE